MPRLTRDVMARSAAEHVPVDPSVYAKYRGRVCSVVGCSTADDAGHDHRDGDPIRVVLDFVDPVSRTMAVVIRDLSDLDARRAGKKLAAKAKRGDGEAERMLAAVRRVRQPA